MNCRNLFLSLILCVGLCADASAQSLSGPLSVRFDLQGGPFGTLTPGPGIEYNGPSPVANRPWNWVVDIQDLRVTATATLMSSNINNWGPIMSLEGPITIPGYTITGVTFSNILPMAGQARFDSSSTNSERLINFQANVDSFISPLPLGTQIQFRADIQVAAVPEPSTCALLGCGVVTLGGYLVRRRRALLLATN